MLFNLFKINYVLSNEQLADHEKAIKAVNEEKYFLLMKS